VSEGFGLNQYLPFVLRRASLLEAPKLRKLQRSAGIKAGNHYELLLALRQFPDGIYVERLAFAASMLQPTASRVLAAMEQAGLVTREQGGRRGGDNADLRRVLVRLTPKGAAEAVKAANVALEHMTAMEKAAPAMASRPVLDALQSVGEVPADGNV
jgi:DNA-binding MarR family transcriptional regulator